MFGSPAGQNSLKMLTDHAEQAARKRPYESILEELVCFVSDKAEEAAQQRRKFVSSQRVRLQDMSI